MTKKSLFFTLLFVFLTFVLQLAVATQITLSPEEEQKVRKQIQEKLNCLNEKKEKLPAKYEGPNLKLKSMPRNFDVANISTSTGMEYYIDSAAVVEIGKKNKDTLPSKYILSKKYTTKRGVVSGECAEYIQIHHIDGYAGFWAYEVTNVPPNSYLKYIPETSEMQVITPANEEYKKFITEYKRQEKKREEERPQREKDKRRTEKISEKIACRRVVEYLDINCRKKILA
ncbi:MAG: hypothetical protein IKP06_01750 [Elusimicrobiaceae bacterium]|nr:hypothetical protein [Elusimicrobiaceae bacterium]